MQYNATTPEEYLNQLELDWRKETLLQIRQWILELAPEAKEGIQYKMLSYGNERGPLFHLNAQKNYVSLYTGDASKIDPERKLLEGLDVGKGCIRIKKSVDATKTGLHAFILQAYQLWQDGQDVGC